MTTFRDSTRITDSDADRHKSLRAMTDGQYLRSGLSMKGVDIVPGAWDFADCSLHELGRISLDWAGVSYRDLSPAQIIRRAFEVDRAINNGAQQGSRSTSFTAILGNVFAKFAQASFSQVPASWRRWCSISTVNDFKRTSRVGLTDAPILERVGGHGEVKTLLLADREEYQQVAPRAGILKIAREVVMNDDLGLIANAVSELGRSGEATVGVGVYNLLTSNAAAGPTLNQDATALFHATHGNLAAAGATLSVTSLNAARKAMRCQTDPESGRRLNVAPTYLLVPPSLEATARILASSDRIDGDPDNLTVVTEAALEEVSSTAWYLVADGALVPTIDVAFVGPPEPDLSTKYSFDTDSLEVRATMNFGVAALDYRGIYRNPGA